MEAYQHEPLVRPEQGLGQIRLVRLRPGAVQDEIQVAIKPFAIEDIAFFGKRDSPRMMWHALSYTWGDPHHTEEITVEVDGDFDTMESDVQLRSLAVTRNLADFLREIRSPSEDRTLWIDAICINQAGDARALEERAWQVKLMHHVYSKAFGVIIWLGKEANDSTYALQLLEDLGSSVSVDFSTSTVSTTTGAIPEAMQMWRNQQPGHPLREFTAMQALLARPWFTRIWIRQEAVLADENNTVVICGSRWITLNDARKALHCLSVMRSDLNCNTALSVFDRQWLDDANLMSRARSSQCGDPRDKVYGNLGIMSMVDASGLAASINVDYTSSNTPERTYLDFFKQYHTRYNTLRLLTEGGLRQGSDMRPTWIPDWKTNPPRLDLSMDYATSHFAIGECVFQEDGSLKVLGCIATTIQQVHTLQPFTVDQKMIDWYQDLYSILNKREFNGDPEVSYERLNRALCCPLNNLLIDLTTAARYRELIKPYVRYLIFFHTNPEDYEYEFELPASILSDVDANWALEQCVTILKRDQLPFIFCPDGLVGIGCQEARPGDVVAAILGCRNLMILRPKGEGKYEVVGPCSIHERNSGEALLGPLPKNTVVMPRLDPSRNAYVPYYHNIQTGEGSTWDPRIAWADGLEAHPPMFDVPVVPAPPGEPLRVRPDSEYLRRHGVALEEMILI